MKILKEIFKNLFLLSILLLMLDLIIGGIFFWKYYFNQPKPKKILPVSINQTLLKNFSSQFSERKVSFQKIPEQQYRDIFNRTASE